MNVPEFAIALRAERDRHYDELTRIIAEFTGTSDVIKISEAAGSDQPAPARRLIPIRTSTPQENTTP